jgi:hypothetical protein
MVVENVKGAQPWVGKAKAHFGSYYLWGDVASVGGRIVSPRPTFGEGVRPARAQKFNPDGTAHPQGSWFAIADSKHRAQKFNPDRTGNGSCFNEAHGEGTKHGGDCFSGYGGGFGWDHSQMRMHSSKSPARKAASAQIAMIPLPISQFIAQIMKPLAVTRASGVI